MNENVEKHWYAIYTRSRSEKKVYNSLKNSGVEAYLPLRTEYHKWSDRRKKIEVPIISMYIFVKIDIKVEREKIFAQPDFITFISENNKPKIIPDTEIDLMKRTIENSVAIQIEDKLLSKGQKVRIATGPMTGVVGVVNEVSAHKVNILLKTLGITLIADFDNIDFEKLSIDSI